MVTTGHENWEEDFDAQDEETTGTIVDKRAFAALFLDVAANEKQIWYGLAKIINFVAARYFPIMRPADAPDIKGDCLLFVMSVAQRDPATAKAAGQGHYDPARGNAYAYFYSVVLNQLRALVKRGQRIQPADLGAVELSFDDLADIDPDRAASVARLASPNNWKTDRLQNPADRHRAAKLIRVTLAKLSAVEAAGRHGADGKFQGIGRGEAAALRVMRATVIQLQASLLGRA